MSFSQQDLEREMVSSGVVRHNERRARNIQNECETRNPAVRRLLSGCIDLYAERIKVWVNNATKVPGVKHTAVKHIGKLRPEVVAFISARTILNAVSTKKTCTRICVKIGEDLEAEINFNKFKQINPCYAQKTKKRLMKTKVGHDFRRKCAFRTLQKVGAKVQYLTPTERLHIGSVCLGLFIESTGLVEIHKKWESPKRWVNMVIATEDCMNWITRFDESKAFLQPKKLPSINVPADWSNTTFYGGYSDDQLTYSFIKTRNKEALNDIVKNTDQRVFTCVNSIQRTSWRVNDWIFKVMHDFWKNGIDDGKEVPMNKLLSLPSRPKEGASKEEIKAYSKKSAYVYSKNAEYRSQRLALAQTLYTAEKLLNVPSFYFPCQLDFRGRIYYVTDCLNPQGSDYAKALLEFGNGVTIDLKKDLLVFARCGFGLWGNKGNSQDILSWFETSLGKIKKSAEQPWNDRWWQEAKNPWQFLRWCREYVDATTRPVFKSHLPITIDCTASGLQILSLLTKDESSARHVNLVQSEAPSDIYGKVLGQLIEELKLDTHEYSSFWLSKVLDRSLTKPICMTLPYGASAYGIRSHIEDWYCTKYGSLPRNVTDFWKCSMYLANKSIEAVKKFIPKGLECMDWLVAVAKPLAEKNKPVCWLSPSGFPCVQPYMASRGSIVKTNLLGKFRYVLLQRTDNNKVHKTKQSKAIAPNFIHSLDASVLHLAFANFHNDVVAIHDCFGTHLSYVNDLSLQLKLSMIEIFKGNPLEDFKQCIKRIDSNISLPNSFETGSFDAGQLLYANYIFV